MNFVFYAAARGPPDMNPIGRLVACAGEAFGIHKGLQIINRMIIEFLPVHTDSAGHLPENMTGQVGDLYPRQDQEPCIAGD